jgi:hypothetical protein
MAEVQTQTIENLFSPGAPTSGGGGGFATGGVSMAGAPADMSQTEKDAIMRQIHPIFLTSHSEEKAPVVVQSNFDKFLNFLRLSLEGFLKLVDIVVDAIIQIARLGVWIVAITGVLIVVTLMTNTTDKFIDLLNESIFKAFGWETRIEKVPTKTETNTTQKSAPVTTNTKTQETPAQLESNTLSDSEAPVEDEPTAEEASLAALRARRAQMAAEREMAPTETTITTPTE